MVDKKSNEQNIWEHSLRILTHSGTYLLEPL